MSRFCCCLLFLFFSTSRFPSSFTTDRMCRYRLKFCLSSWFTIFVYNCACGIRTVIHVNAADIMHTACYVQLQEIYRNAALVLNEHPTPFKWTCKHNISLYIFCNFKEYKLYCRFKCIAVFDAWCFKNCLCILLNPFAQTR